MPEPRPDLQIAADAPSRTAQALDRAAERLAGALRALDADARRVEPWLGDPVSAEAAARYAGHAAEGPDAAIERLRGLHTELVRAREAVAASGRDYVTTEDAITRSWSVR
ncbi:PE domain-containing protein [Pseudonocardia sp. HH130630-07]|uniref:PE domain-containing protein n=1 Tax=Pseudonocardia sp. HH130630-07 TaxID=1690815 RepID=UPI000814CB5C|nr:PE domain-containing protein [Pseudonocardia sp. HH130630-07]ANY07530.1 hypothetical protein AFB00_15895 [Pseudonocardia sp. HH130630-07]